MLVWENQIGVIAVEDGRKETLLAVHSVTQMNYLNTNELRPCFLADFVFVDTTYLNTNEPLPVQKVRQKQ